MDINGRVRELEKQYLELKQRKEYLGRITLPHLYKADEYIQSNPDLALEAKAIEKEILTKKDDSMVMTISSPYKTYDGDTLLVYIVDNYRNDTLGFIAEVTGISLELYLLSMFEECDIDSQKIISKIISSTVNDLETNLTKEDINKSKEMYENGMISESIQALGDAMEKNMSTENKIENTHEVKVNEALSMYLNTAINDVNSIKDKEEVETKEETTEETTKEGFMDKYESALKVGAGVVGVGLVAYAGYKIYEHFMSDDVVIVDSSSLEIDGISDQNYSDLERELNYML